MEGRSTVNRPAGLTLAPVLPPAVFGVKPYGTNEQVSSRLISGDNLVWALGVADTGYSVGFRRTYAQRNVCISSAVHHRDYGRDGSRTCEGSYRIEDIRRTR